MARHVYLVEIETDDVNGAHLKKPDVQMLREIVVSQLPAALLKSVVVNKSRYDPQTQIQLIWSLEDVKSIRSDLTDEQCLSVLDAVEHHHDCTIGVTWDTLAFHASSYPRRVQLTREETIAWLIDCADSYSADYCAEIGLTQFLEAVESGTRVSPEIAAKLRSLAQEWSEDDDADIKGDARAIFILLNEMEEGELTLSGKEISSD